VLTLVLAGLLMLAARSMQVAADSSTLIYVARNVITMDPALPAAEAVAVTGGRISWVGNRDAMAARFPPGSTEIDTRFADAVLMPGFIEPHLHPYIAGILLSMEFITPHDWNLSGRKVAGVRGRDAYLDRLRKFAVSLESDTWAWTWGYHPLFHGRLSRRDLDEISGGRPVVVWHRSFHEIYLNSAAIGALALDEAAARAHPQVDFERGHFFENGLKLLLPALAPRLFEPGRYHAALHRARQIIHSGGITTVGDGAFGTIDLETEWQLLRTSSWNGEDAPFRSYLLADGKSLGERLGHKQALNLIESLPARDGPRLRFLRRQVKLFADGAAYSQLMQLSEPYLDGHDGEWLMEPEALEAAAGVYWRAGFQIHLHVNGDAGLDAALGILARLQQEMPREDHRFTIHHLAYARAEQAGVLAGLGGMVQANPYYLWALADSYSQHGLGPERAAAMVPLGSFAQTGMPIAFHSDFTMAPARPLLLAWVAANRITASGAVMTPAERIGRGRALRGITIDAAFQMGLEEEIGSISVGKRADFVVLGEDPLKVPLEELAEIPILGTVLEGRVQAVSEKD
jgi:predicted amidohydrolase YtcJ